MLRILEPAAGKGESYANACRLAALPLCGEGHPYTADLPSPRTRRSEAVAVGKLPILPASGKMSGE